MNNRGFSKILILIIVIIFIIGGILAWQYWWIPKSFAPTPATTPTPIEEFNLDNFMKEIKNKIVNEDLFKIKDYNNNFFFLKEHEEGIGEENGINWFNEKNEVEFVKGYALILKLEEWDNLQGKFVTSTGKDITKEEVDKITTYLSSLGFIQNKKNTYNIDSETFRVGLEKNNIKCVNRKNPTYWSLECGNISKSITPSVYKEIYMAEYENLGSAKSYGLYLGVDRVADNFAMGTLWVELGVVTSGKKVIWEKENGDWKEIATGGEGPYACDKLLDKKVPYSLLEGCAFYGVYGGEKCQDYMKDIKEDIRNCDEYCVKSEEYGEVLCDYERLYQSIFGEK